MRPHLFVTGRLPVLAGAALLVTSCGGGGGEAANQSDASPDANMMIDAPANDASALESAANATEPAAPADNGSQGNDAIDAPGNGSGGDAGAGRVESNVSGM